MLDFTSALYLGLRHGSGSLRPWSALTTGVPAARPVDAAAAGVTVPITSAGQTRRGHSSPGAIRSHQSAIHSCATGSYSGTDCDAEW